MVGLVRYVGKKTLNAVLILIVATVCIFAMVKASGLDPVLATQQGGRISEEVLQAKMERYGLNRPLTLYRRSGNTLSSDKFLMIRRTWNLYRNVEKLRLPHSIWCFMFYAFHAVARRL